MSSRFSDSQSEGRNSSSAGDNDKNDSDDDDDDDDDDAGHSSNVMSIFASYYGIEATGEGANGSPKGVEDHKRPAIDFINAAKFKPNAYVKELLLSSDFDTLMEKDHKMVQEIKTLDSDMQMLVYENYNKFISATETIKHMKLNIEKMYTETKHFSGRMKDIELAAEKIDNAMRPQLESVSKLVRIRRLLSRLEFLSELPEKLERLISDERYEVAVKLYKESIGTLQKSRNLNFLSFQNIKERTITMMEDLRLRVVNLMDDPSSSSNKLTTYAQVLRMMEAPRDMVYNRFLNTHSRRFAELFKPFDSLLFSSHHHQQSSSSSSSSSSSTIKAVNISDIRKFHQLFTLDVIEVNKGTFELFSNENKHDDIHAILDNCASAAATSGAAISNKETSNTASSNRGLNGDNQPSSSTSSTSISSSSSPSSTSESDFYKISMLRSASNATIDVPVAVVKNLYSHFQALIRLKGLLTDVIAKYTLIITKQFTSFFDQLFTSSSPLLPNIQDESLNNSIVFMRQCFMDMQYADNSSIAEIQLVTNFALNCWIIKTKISDISHADLVESILSYCYSQPQFQQADSVKLKADLEASSGTFSTAFIKNLMPVLQKSFVNRLVGKYIDDCSSNVILDFNEKISPLLLFDESTFKEAKTAGQGANTNPFSGGNVAKGVLSKKISVVKDSVQTSSSSCLNHLIGNLCKLFKLVIDVYNTSINANNKLAKLKLNSVTTSALDASFSGGGGSNSNSKKDKHSQNNSGNSSSSSNSNSSSRNTQKSQLDSCGSMLYGNLIGGSNPAKGVTGSGGSSIKHKSSIGNTSNSSNNVKNSNLFGFPEDIFVFTSSTDLLHCYIFASIESLCSHLEAASNAFVPRYYYDQSFESLYRLDGSINITLSSRVTTTNNNSSSRTSQAKVTTPPVTSDSEDKAESTNKAVLSVVNYQSVFLSALLHQLKSSFTSTLERAISSLDLFPDDDDDDVSDYPSKRLIDAHTSILRRKCEARLEVSAHYIFLSFLTSTSTTIEGSMKHLLLDIYRSHRHMSENVTFVDPCQGVVGFALSCESIYLTLSLLLPTNTSSTTSTSAVSSSSGSSSSVGVGVSGPLIPTLSTSSSGSGQSSNGRKQQGGGGQKVKVCDVQSSVYQAGRVVTLGSKKYPLFSIEVVLGSVFKAAVASLTENVKLLTITKTVYTHLNGTIQFIHNLSSVFLRPEGVSLNSSDAVPGTSSYASHSETAVALLVDALNMALLSRYADANDFSAVMSNNSSSSSGVKSSQVVSMYMTAVHQGSIVM